MIESILILMVLILFGASRLKEPNDNSIKFRQNRVAQMSDRHRRSIAFNYKVLGKCLMASSGFLFFIFGTSVLGNPLEFKEIVIIIAAFVLAGKIYQLGYRSLRHARRLEALPADEILLQDPRLPVLYLRSFKDDVTTSESETIVGMQGTSGPTVTATEEEQMVQALKLMGPVIAIGSPGEELPPTGAARKYVAYEEDWKVIVSQYISRARAVVMRAGNSEGFWWELERAVHLASPDRLLILVPFSKQEYQGFRERADKFLPRRLPEYDGQRSYGTLTGCICFRNDWLGSFLRLKFPSEARATDMPLVPMLHFTLEPFFQQIGINEEGIGRTRYHDENGEWERVYRFLKGVIPFLPRSSEKGLTLFKLLIAGGLIMPFLVYLMVTEPSFVCGLGVAFILLICLSLVSSLKDNEN